jgi:hypothetical protein
MSRNQHQSTARAGKSALSGRAANPAPETREEFGFSVRSILMDFRHAASGWEVAFSLSHALHDLLESRASAFRLGDIDHAALLDTIYSAWQVADDRMPAHFNRSRLVDGMEAATSIVDRWRLPLRDREHRVSSRSADIFLRAEILKNEFHSIGLEEDVARRIADREAARRKRREETIAAMAVVPAEYPGRNFGKRAA